MTVAEGIEDPSMLSELRQAGCEMGQGYYFSRPLPAEELATLLVVEPEAVRTPRRRSAFDRLSAG